MRLDCKESINLLLSNKFKILIIDNFGRNLSQVHLYDTDSHSMKVKYDLPIAAVYGHEILILKEYLYNDYMSIKYPMMIFIGN